MKKRADQLLVERGQAESRTKAQALIMAGIVFVGAQRVAKASEMYASETALEVKGKDHPYVSRGGMKLAAALEHFRINPEGFVALDIGASTGGFTDVLLRAGAKSVYAVDVGTNQLAYSLRQDPRVVVLEKMNARHLTRQDIPVAPQIIVCDASFISLKTVLPAPLSLAAKGAILIALIKPQFEVGKGLVGKGGIVRDPALHESVCASIRTWLEEDMKWHVEGITESPITGAEGNKEFLLCARQ